MPPKGGYNKLTSYPPEYRDKVDRERKARVACVTRLAHLKRLKDTTTDEAKLQKLNDEIIEKNNDLRKHDENLAGMDSAVTLSAVELAEDSGVSVDNALDQAEQGIKLARLARSTQKGAHNQIASMHEAFHPPAFDDDHADVSVSSSSVPAGPSSGHAVAADPADAKPITNALANSDANIIAPAGAPSGSSAQIDAQTNALANPAANAQDNIPTDASAEPTSNTDANSDANINASAGAQFGASAPSDANTNAPANPAAGALANIHTNTNAKPVANINALANPDDVDDA